MKYLITSRLKYLYCDKPFTSAKYHVTWRIHKYLTLPYDIVKTKDPELIGKTLTKFTHQVYHYWNHHIDVTDRNLTIINKNFMQIFSTFPGKGYSLNKWPKDNTIWEKIFMFSQNKCDNIKTNIKCIEDIDNIGECLESVIFSGNLLVVKYFYYKYIHCLQKRYIVCIIESSLHFVDIRLANCFININALDHILQWLYNKKFKIYPNNLERCDDDYYDDIFELWYDPIKNILYDLDYNSMKNALNNNYACKILIKKSNIIGNGYISYGMYN
jgi:hypothetical protein